MLFNVLDDGFLSYIFCRDFEKTVKGWNETVQEKLSDTQQ